VHVEGNSRSLIRDTIHPDSRAVGLRKTTTGLSIKKWLWSRPS